MSRRLLLWRLWWGSCCIDLIREVDAGEGVVFVGLVDGREYVRHADRQEAGSRLLRAVKARSDLTNMA